MEKRMNRFWQSAIGSCLVGMSLVATGCGITTASAADERVGGTAQKLSGSFRLIARHSGKCLGVSAASQDNGAKLIQWDCTGGGEQRFSFADGPDGHTEIRPGHSGFNKCLGVSQGKSDNGTNVIQWDCTGGNEQKYRLEGVGDGYYRIHPRHSDKCLGVSASSQDNGAEVIQWDCVAVSDQLFKLD